MQGRPATKSWAGHGMIDSTADFRKPQELAHPAAGDGVNQNSRLTFLDAPPWRAQLCARRTISFTNSIRYCILFHTNPRVSLRSNITASPSDPAAFQ